jgi:hypothetical protein
MRVLWKAFLEKKQDAAMWHQAFRILRPIPIRNVTNKIAAFHCPHACITAPACKPLRALQAQEE